MAQGSPSNQDGQPHPNLVRDAYGLIRTHDADQADSTDCVLRTSHSVSHMPTGHIQRLKEFQALQARRAMESMFYGVPISKPKSNESGSGNQESEQT
ncbi:MAG: hypothetical protein QGF00_21995 [Planctomycetota bacterium]|nr:hypothetical protein [Planctomycetota bacterium]